MGGAHKEWIYFNKNSIYGFSFKNSFFVKVDYFVKNWHFDTVVLAFLSRYRPISVAVPSPSRPHTVAVPMGRRYLNVTHRSKKKDAVLKRPVTS